MHRSSEALRVLVVSHAAVISVNQEPFEALAGAGLDVTIVAPRALRTDIRGRVEVEALRGSRARVRPVPILLGGYRGAFGGQRGIHFIVYRGVSRVLADVRPDVLFVEEEPYSLAALQWSRAAARERRPLVIHENQNIDRRVPFPFESIRRAVLRSAAGVTVRSAAAKELVRAHGFAGPVAMFPHAVDPTRYRSAERRTQLPAPVIGFVGRLVEEKGLLDVIDAIGKMDRRASLLVVGDGPLRAEAEARAAGLQARFVGPIEHADVPGWYASMDVVAIPSRTTPTWKEQFGRVVIEANAARVPVVVTDSGELPMTVAATGGGIVVREGDVGALADAIGALAGDPDRRRALGDAGAAAVAARFTPRAVADELAAFLRDIAA